MSGKKRGTYVELGDDLDASVRAFCEALYGARKSRVIRDAIDHFIERELHSNDGLRARYEAIRDRERRVSGANLKVIDK